MNGILVSVLFVFLSFCSFCSAESLPIVRGRVEGDFAFVGAGLTVELADLERPGSSNRSAVGSDGSFEFRDILTGRRMLRLTSFTGQIICEQLVEIFAYTGELSVRPPRMSQERPVSGTISVRQLQEKIPPKAFRAFAEAQRDAASGHEVEAVRKLEQALRLYPDYSAARCNLGVQYIRQGRYDAALEQLEKALASGDPSPLLYGNLSYAYQATGRSREAEQAARRALAIDGHYGPAHYLLGSILGRNVRPNALEKAPEALQHLRLGERDVPHAYIEIAQIYLAQGDRLSAAEELRLYLKTGDAQYRANVEGWLKRILGN